MNKFLLIFSCFLFVYACKDKPTQFVDASGTEFGGIQSGAGNPAGGNPTVVNTLIPTPISPDLGGFGEQGVPDFPTDPVTPPADTGGNTICKPTFVVHFRFVVDVTTSMRDVFPVIKSNAQSFAQNALAALKTASTESVQGLFSLSKYDDNLDNRASHGNLVSLNSFINAVDNLRVSEHDNNKDWPENGLTALESLMSRVNPQTALTIIVLITDNFSHRGGPVFNRDYSLNAFTNSVNGKVTETPVFLFDATLTSLPTDDPHMGPGQILPSYAPVPSEQWNVARTRSSGKLIGKNIGFPLNSTALVGEIPDFIAAHKREICL